MNHLQVTFDDLSSCSSLDPSIQENTIHNYQLIDPFEDSIDIDDIVYQQNWQNNYRSMSLKFLNQKEKMVLTANNLDQNQKKFIYQDLFNNQIVPRNDNNQMTHKNGTNLETIINHNQDIKGPTKTKHSETIIDAPPSKQDEQYSNSSNNSIVKNSRRERFPRQMLQRMRCEFEQISKTQKSPQESQSFKGLSKKHNLSISTVLRLYRQWLLDPTMAKYFNKTQEPLGALIDGKRQRTLMRIKIISQMLRINPFLTQKQISDKLFQIDPTKKKILRSAIIRLMKIAGFKKKKVDQDVSLTEESLKAQQSFCKLYQNSKNQNMHVFYLDEYMFHRHFSCDLVWAKQDDDTINPYSKQMVEMSVILIMLIGDDGQMLWQMRAGNYNDDEFTKLAGKMFKKGGQNIAKKIVILKENPIRSVQLASISAKKYGFNIEVLDDNCRNLSPIQIYFSQLKQKIKKNVFENSAKFGKIICDHIKTLTKDDILMLFKKSQAVMQKISKL